MKRVQVKKLFVIAVLFLLFVPLQAQQENGETQSPAVEATPQVDPVTAPPATEVAPVEPEPEPLPQLEPEPLPRPQPVVRESAPVARPEVLDAWDDLFRHRRLAGYVPRERDQIVAAIDEPDLQDGDGAAGDQNGDSAVKKPSFVFKGSLAYLAAWSALFFIIVFIFILYYARTGRKRRKVFRNIPSKKRSLRNKYNKYNKY